MLPLAAQGKVKKLITSYKMDNLQVREKIGPYPFSFLIEKRLTEAESCSRKYKDKEIKTNCC
jgi:hypothetical protein